MDNQKNRQQPEAVFQRTDNNVLINSKREKDKQLPTKHYTEN